jgi:hypothetical protein
MTSLLQPGSRADEIEAAASRAAATMREEAESLLADARKSADQVQLEAQQESASLVAAAEARAEEIVAEARVTRTAVDTEDELEAMLAATEQEIGMSEELRLRRAELDQAEKELAERERALAAQQEEAATISIPIPAEEVGESSESPVGESTGVTYW